MNTSKNFISAKEGKVDIQHGVKEEVEEVRFRVDGRVAGVVGRREGTRDEILAGFVGEMVRRGRERRKGEYIVKGVDGLEGLFGKEVIGVGEVFE
jgi:hypothetical protein